LDTHDGFKIQAFFLPAAKRYERAHDAKIFAGNTMVICNPNAGYAEVQQYSNEFLDFYLDFGINVVLWNYRGYGNSSGIPSPESNRADAEVVFDWAKRKTEESVNGKKQVKIGAHGVSIGGLAASHLGRIGAVDFLFLDRTFSSIKSIP
jgi:uncharacterized protein